MNDEIKESAKAIQEVAKTSGKAIDSAQKFCTFISEFAQGSLEQAFGIFEDKLKYARWKNQQNLMWKTREYMAKHGLKVVQPLPLKYAVPLLQGASLEDEDSLQDKWATLLANSVCSQNSGFQRIFIDLLERLNPTDAVVLDKFYSIPYELAVHNLLVTSQLPSQVTIDDGNFGIPEILPSQEVCNSLITLDGMNCISLGKSIHGGQFLSRAHQTLLGRRFLDACSFPTSNQKSDPFWSAT